MLHDDPATTPETTSLLARRGLLGAGAATLAGSALVAGPAGPAAADDPVAEGTSTDRPGRAQRAVVVPTLASPPVRGYVYRTVSQWDLSPENPAANRQWSATGMYTTGASTTLWASVEAPAGASFRDVEVYATNTSGAATTAQVRLWTSSTGYMSEPVLQVTIPPGPGLRAVRVDVPDDARGPYESGTKLCLGLVTTTSGSVRLNGARFGFSGGGHGVGLLPTPRRILNTQQAGGALKAGVARTVSVPPGLLTPATAGVIVAVTALRATKAGSLRVYAADRAVPATETLLFPRNATAQAHSVVVPLSASGKVRLRSSANVHVRLDVLGTIG